MACGSLIRAGWRIGRPSSVFGTAVLVISFLIGGGSMRCSRPTRLIRLSDDRNDFVLGVQQCS